jgi:hypothetical protein
MEANLQNELLIPSPQTYIALQHHPNWPFVQH